MISGVVVACALGVIAMKVAWATRPAPGTITPTAIAGPVNA